MKIYFIGLRTFDEQPVVDELSKKYHFSYAFQKGLLKDEDYAKLQGFDAISIPPFPCNFDVVKKLHQHQIRFILTRSIGIEHIDLEACKQFGIQVINASYSPDAVGEFTIMLMLMALRKVKQIQNDVPHVNFSFQNKLGTNLSSLTVGVIGTGEIGKKVISLLSAFGCRILAYSRNQSVHHVTYVDLPTLLSQSDIITLHTASTPETQHILNQKTLSHLKESAIIINTARGNLIDTKALLDTLEDHPNQYACIDVFENETGLINRNFHDQMPKHEYLSKLINHPQILFFPHMAFYTHTSIEQIQISTIEQLYQLEK